MPNQTHDPFSSLTTQEKQFLYVLGRYPKEVRWEHVYKAWDEAPKEKLSLDAGHHITALYTGEEVWNHYLDLVEEATSKRPWQAISKKLGLTGPNGANRQLPIIRDDTLEMMELPATALRYDGVVPTSLLTEKYLVRTYLFLWPNPTQTSRGHSCVGFTIRKSVSYDT